MEANGYSVTREAGYMRICVHHDRLEEWFAPRLKSELVVLTGTGVRNVVLDLSPCQWCSTAVVDALLVGNRLCRSAGGQFILTGVSPSVERIMSSLRVDSLLAIAYSQAQVMALL